MSEYKLTPDEQAEISADSFEAASSFLVIGAQQLTTAERAELLKERGAIEMQLRHILNCFE